MSIVIVEGMKIPRGEWTQTFQMVLRPEDQDFLKYLSTFCYNDRLNFLIDVEEL